MNFRYNSNRDYYNPYYTSRPAYNPVMTQMGFNNFYPPPLYTPVYPQNSINFNYPPISSTPINSFSNTIYNPIMTEPSKPYKKKKYNCYGEEYYSSDSDNSSDSVNTFIINKKIEKDEFKQINNREFKKESNDSHQDISEND